MYFRKDSKERRLWDETRQRVYSLNHEYRQQANEYAKEVRQSKINKWTERVLRWFIIISIIMIYNLFIGAIAIHIYQ
jgi:hypothetical protein